MAEVMATGITFRLATLQDVDAILEVEETSFTTPWSRQAFYGELDDNLLARYIVAVLDGKIIGYAGVWIICDEGHVTNIAIHPAYRGRHYGEQMVRCLINLARSCGAVSMTLEVRASNIIAQTLYKKLGFEARGHRKGYYADNNEDAIIMWKDNI